MKPVYITSSGSYLPGKPICNDEVESYWGFIKGKKSRTKNRILKQNGIKTRYYGINKKQESLTSNEEMALSAIKDCLLKSELVDKNIEFFATGTTQGDLPIPGFASMVHGKANFDECEIASHQSVCSASMMAIKNAYNNIKLGEKNNGLVCTSEFASRLFKSSRFEKQNRPLSLQEDFFRWMLSDGAGALLLENVPSKNKISLKK